MSRNQHRMLWALALIILGVTATAATYTTAGTGTAIATAVAFTVIGTLIVFRKEIGRHKRRTATIVGSIAFIGGTLGGSAVMAAAPQASPQQIRPMWDCSLPENNGVAECPYTTVPQSSTTAPESSTTEGPTTTEAVTTTEGPTTTEGSTTTAPHGHNPVTLCHEEGNGSYHTITVDDDAVFKAGHDQHAPGGNGDIIPPFDYYDGEGNLQHYPGKGDQSLLAYDDCDAPDATTTTEGPTTTDEATPFEAELAVCVNPSALTAAYSLSTSGETGTMGEGSAFVVNPENGGSLGSTDFEFSVGDTATGEFALTAAVPNMLAFADLVVDGNEYAIDAVEVTACEVPVVTTTTVPAGPTTTLPAVVVPPTSDTPNVVAPPSHNTPGTTIVVYGLPSTDDSAPGFPPMAYVFFVIAGLGGLVLLGSHLNRPRVEKV